MAQRRVLSERMRLPQPVGLGAGRVVRDDDFEAVALERLLGQRFEQPPQPQRPVV
jgi:hypothetical protein